MNYKCLGCGVVLQDNDVKKIGYVKNLSNKYCERCFRINNYNEYTFVEKDSKDFEKIIEKIIKTNDLVVLVVDIMSINDAFYNLDKKIKNNILLVVSKRDILSYKINDENILNKIKINCIDKIMISSNKNYNLDLLMSKIKKYKLSKNVYVVGLTNAGKSTLINKIIYNYTKLEDKITTSILPSTTLENINISIDNDLTLIDTPGIIDKKNICNYLDVKDLKKIFPKKEIKPITYQIKKIQYIYIEDLVMIETTDDCNLTFYFSNQLKIERLYKKKENDNLVCNNIETKNNCDIVINGMGFINLKKKTTLKVYTLKDVSVYIRDELI